MFLKKGLFYLQRTLTNWKDIFHPLTLQMTAMAGAKPGQSQESEAPCISTILGAESHSRFTIKELDQMWSSRDLNQWFTWNANIVGNSLTHSAQS